MQLHGGIEIDADILIHRPLPQKELKGYVIRDLFDIVEQEGLWSE